MTTRTRVGVGGLVGSGHSESPPPQENDEFASPKTELLGASNKRVAHTSSRKHIVSNFLRVRLHFSQSQTPLLTNDTRRRVGIELSILTVFAQFHSTANRMMTSRIKTSVRLSLAPAPALRFRPRLTKPRSETRFFDPRNDIRKRSGLAVSGVFVELRRRAAHAQRYVAGCKIAKVNPLRAIVVYSPGGFLDALSAMRSADNLR